MNSSLLTDVPRLAPARKCRPTWMNLAGRDIFICGGAQVYEQALPFCSDLYLTLVKRVVEGDTFFPPFETRFELVEEIRDEPEFKISRYCQIVESLKAETLKY